MWSRTNLLLMETKFNPIWSNNFKYFFWWLRKVLGLSFPLLLEAPGFTAFWFWCGRHKSTILVSVWSLLILFSTVQSLVGLLPRLVPTKLSWSSLVFCGSYGGTQLSSLCSGHRYQSPSPCTVWRTSGEHSMSCHSLQDLLCSLRIYTQMTGG